MIDISEDQIRKMRRRSISFISYDPYTDQRIDPMRGSDLHKHPEIPSCIHDAVSKAKYLVGNRPHKELLEYAFGLDVIAQDSSFLLRQKSRFQGERDYSSADETDKLLAFIEQNEDSYSLEEWPVLFGVLALSFAGEIINTVWPSEAYLAATLAEKQYIDAIRRDTGKPPNSAPPPYSKDLLWNFAVESVRAVGVGLGLEHIAKQSKIGRVNAKSPSKKHLKLYGAFECWALKYGRSNVYGSTKEAVERGFVPWLKEQESIERNFEANPTLTAARPEISRARDVRLMIGETTYKRMKTHLEKHCEEQGRPYPFPIKTSR